MAKVYSPPEVLPVPDFKPWDTYDERCEAWIGELRAWVDNRARKVGKRPHKLAGKEVRLPWADGCARYMVLSGTELIWMPVGDAWNVPDYQTRGLRAADIERLAV